jgi:hypothetical protein
MKKKSYLAKALVSQFQVFVGRTVDDVENIIPSEYQKQILGVKEEVSVIHGVLYP